MNLNNMSIKNKLVGIILLAVLLAVSVGFTTVVVINIGSLEQDLVNNVLMNATLVSEYCVVPMTFEDEAALTRSLQTLRSIPFIENGSVFDTDGILLATYAQTDEIPVSPSLAQEEPWYLEGDHLHVTQSIVHDDRELGTLNLQATTDLLRERINLFLWTMIWIGVGLIILSYFLALKLQSVISKPILSLAEVTRRITKNEDYTMRVQAQRSDEVGELYSGFNNMLEHVYEREQERDRALKALEYRNVILSTQIENSPNGILIVDENGNWTSFNSRFGEIWGFSEQVLKANSGEVAMNALEPNLFNPAEFRQRVNFIHENKESYCQDEITLKNGQIIDRYSAPMRGDDGRYLGRVWFFRDISETKRLQELESRASRLEMAGTISGQVAHDLNNLLAPVMAYPDLIRKKLQPEDPSHLHLNAIQNAAKNISTLSQELLVLGRRGHYNLEVLDLNRIVTQAALEMKSRTQSVKVETHLCNEIMKFKGGPSQIHRMLTNLLVNAMDAMDNRGQITVTTQNHYADDTSLAFGLVPRGEYVKLTVSDTGCGIADDMVQKIFDPFFSNKTATQQHGSGLGLSVVDAVIKDHHGYLDLKSEVGSGTSFYIYFPTTREGSKENESELLATGTETVLVVDDDEIQRQVSEQLLTTLGYRVSTVDSGERAIEFLRETSQSLIILDMVMPGGIDGAETYRQILEINQHQKAILLSGFSESERVLMAQKLGAGRFVQKPVTKRVLAAAVRTELDQPTEAKKTGFF